MNSYDQTFEGKLRKYINQLLLEKGDLMWRFPDEKEYKCNCGFMQGLEAVLAEMEHIASDINKGR